MEIIGARKSLRWLGAGLAGTFALCLASCSKSEPQPVSELQPPGATPSSSASNSAVASALSGKLVKIQNGAAVAAAIQGDPEYFVFYHSASW